METNDILSFKRLLLLMRRQILSGANGLLIAFGGFAGVLLIISLLVAYFNPPALSGLTVAYFSVMFLGGYIYTSSFYSELHQVQKSYSYLTLPVSLTERLLSAWLITAVLFPVFSVLAMSVIVLVANLLMNLTVELSPFQSVFSAQSLKLVGIYMVTQSVFLLGAAYFKKNNFLKTLLALFVISLIINAYTALLGWGLFRGVGNEMAMMDEQAVFQPFENLVTQTFPAVFKFIFWYVTIPFFMVTTWFSLKERQV